MKVAWPRSVARHLDRTGHDADLLLEVERGFTGLAAAIDDGEEDGRPHRRMAREGQFLARREDAQARPMPVLRRIADEHGLGKVELPRDRLHATVIEAFRVEHHGERVALEHLAREHVEGVETTRHDRVPFARNARWTCPWRTNAFPGPRSSSHARPQVVHIISAFYITSIPFVITDKICYYGKRTRVKSAAAQLRLNPDDAIRRSFAICPCCSSRQREGGSAR